MYYSFNKCSWLDCSISWVNYLMQLICVTINYGKIVFHIKSWYLQFYVLKFYVLCLLLLYKECFDKSTCICVFRSPAPAMIPDFTLCLWARLLVTFMFFRQYLVVSYDNIILGAKIVLYLKVLQNDFASCIL